MACKTCNKSKKKSKKRGNIGAIKMGNLPTEKLIAAAAGALAGKASDGLIKQIPVAALQENPMIRDAIKIGVGLFLSVQENEMLASFGVGMTAYAGAKLVGSFLPANLNDAVAGLYGTGRYQSGTGPLQISGMNGGGMQGNFQSIGGQGGYRAGLGTYPDAIVSGIEEEDDIRFV